MAAAAAVTVVGRGGKAAAADVTHSPMLLGRLAWLSAVDCRHVLKKYLDSEYASEISKRICPRKIW